MPVSNGTRGVKKNRAAQPGQYTIHPPSHADAYEDEPYVFQEFPMMLHGRDQDGPMEIIVHDAVQRDRKLAEGWSKEPVSGPKVAAEPEKVRTPMSADALAALPAVSDAAPADKPVVKKPAPKK